MAVNPSPFGSGGIAPGSGTSPNLPAYFTPAKWAFANLDTGPDIINATYAPGFIGANAGTAANSGGANVASYILTVPAGAAVGDFAVLVHAINNAGAGEIPKVTATSGHIWTQIGPTLVTTTAGFSVSTAVFGRTITAGDAGDTLTLAAVSGDTFTGGAALESYTPPPGQTISAAVGATAAPAGHTNSQTAPPASTGAQAGTLALYLLGADSSGGTAAVSAVPPASVTSRQSTSANGNIALIGDSGQVYAANSSVGGAGVTFSGTTGSSQYTMMTLLLVPSAAPLTPTLTANSNGVLTVDGGSPAPGDRVVVADPFLDIGRDGIYVVTSAGSAGSKWAMARSADMATAATLGQFWTVPVTSGAVYGGGNVSVAALFDVAGPQVFVMGVSTLGLAVSAPSTLCLAPWGTAAGNSSTVSGTQASTTGTNANATGDSCVAQGNHSWAGGTESQSFGANSAALGSQVKTGTGASSALALGRNALAYTPDQIAMASGQIATQGDAQFSRVTAAGQTTNNTQTTIAPLDGTITFQDSAGNPYWKRTIGCRFYAAARRADTPGTDSFWSAQGVLRGDGSAAYSWVGGSPPAFTVIAQDAAAAAWAPAVSITSNTLVVKVTGALAATINWVIVCEFYEVAG